MIARGRIFLAGVICVSLAACATVPRGPDPQAVRDAIAARMMRDIEVLASDEFGGRKPGTPGGEKTIAYIVDRMQQIGLQSGTNDPGSAWRAPVELVSTKPLNHEITVRTAKGASVLPIASSAAFSLSSRVLIDGVEVVFVGDGKGQLVDTELVGRIVVVTQSNSDPDVRETLFAARPAAVLTVVADSVALERERGQFQRERLLLTSEDSNNLSAFVTNEAFSNTLPDGEWNRLLEKASRENFSHEMLAATIAIDVHSTRREFTSSNVIGMIPGQLPGSGAVLLMAHWDHFGECAPGTPDPICNGAVDNASGIALMLELAAKLQLNGPHDRDIYLLATSAEESGLLGAKSFVDAPPIPLESIVAAFNFDTVAVAPAGGPFGFIGEGQTPLDDVVREAVREQGAELGSREYAQSFLRRHDGWTLLQEGVPSVLVSTAFASEIVLGPYLATNYHRPTDQIEGLELGGAIDDLLLHETLVKQIASTQSYPASATLPSQ
ncbi:M20/M25/M40 family metallo-hydrolase [uncultured Erythrobacter sp.]|uniref:M20/M25/M40 family metallo-hydrolase n=1 Tax=uncultured Erythrobacter sp. TaxID=263913 RepID=UPI002634DBD2|nr:M20/M25/M40 family metallo-hydrolase [uncultured Erythrobacter sp.]